MTVQELIDRLKAHPPGALVVVGDADTGWFLHLTCVRATGSAVELGGNYDEQWEPDDEQWAPDDDDNPSKY